MNGTKCESKKWNRNGHISHTNCTQWVNGETRARARTYSEKEWRTTRYRIGCKRKTERTHTLTYTKYGSNECIKVNKSFVRQPAAFGPVWHSLPYLYAFFFDERVAAHSFYFFMRTFRMNFFFPTWDLQTFEWFVWRRWCHNDRANSTEKSRKSWYRLGN